MEKFVSIVIVNWNGKKWLERCLESLAQQTYKSFEIILVDNASEDDSVEFVRSHFPLVKIVQSEKNLGFSGGNNLGIEKAVGELIMLLNNDTWVENNFLEEMVETLYKSGCDIVGPIEADYYSKEKLGDYSIHLDPLGHFIYLFGKNRRNDDFYLSGVCLLFRKELYLNSLGLDDNFFMYAEDWDWFWRLHLLDKKIYKNDDVIIYHKGAGSTGGGVKYVSFLWRNQNTLQMLLKNYSWFNLVWTLPIYFLINIVEIVFFIVMGKPKISLSYVEGWWFNLRNLKKILEKRKWVQKNRLVSDYRVFQKMYFGFGKIHHVINFYK